MAIFPLLSLKAQRVPVAEIIKGNNTFDFYEIKLINNEFFIIKDIGVFRIQDGIPKIYKGKVRVYQYNVESLNPVDPRMLKGITNFCKQNNFREVIPLMTEITVDKDNKTIMRDGKAPPFEIHQPLEPRHVVYLHNFASVDPVHIYNFYKSIQQAGQESHKWISKKLLPKMEIKNIMMIIIGGAIAFVIVGNFMISNSGSFDMDFFIPRAFKEGGGEFIFGIKLFAHKLIGGLSWLLH